jgi:hypothetical protein
LRGPSGLLTSILTLTSSDEFPSKLLWVIEIICCPVLSKMLEWLRKQLSSDHCRLRFWLM